MTGFALLREAEARKLLAEGTPLIWNATNVSAAMRAAPIDPFAAYGAKVTIVCLEAGEPELLRRNAARVNAVPVSAIEPDARPLAAAQSYGMASPKRRTRLRGGYSRTWSGALGQVLNAVVLQGVHPISGAALGAGGAIYFTGNRVKYYGHRVNTQVPLYNNLRTTYLRYERRPDFSARSDIYSMPYYLPRPVALANIYSVFAKMIVMALCRAATGHGARHASRGANALK